MTPVRRCPLPRRRYWRFEAWQREVDEVMALRLAVAYKDIEAEARRKTTLIIAGVTASLTPVEQIVPGLYAAKESIWGAGR